MPAPGVGPALSPLAPPHWTSTALRLPPGSPGRPLQAQVCAGQAVGIKESSQPKVNGLERRLILLSQQHEVACSSMELVGGWGGRGRRREGSHARQTQFRQHPARSGNWQLRHTRLDVSVQDAVRVALRQRVQYGAHVPGNLHRWWRGHACLLVHVGLPCACLQAQLHPPSFLCRAAGRSHVPAPRPCTPPSSISAARCNHQPSLAHAAPKPNV